MKVWSIDSITQLMGKPLLELVHQAAVVHRQHHDPRLVQLSSLISIKTGGCPEDCSYCPQAARYATDVKRQALLSLQEVLDHARSAQSSGTSRVCMGAAWRQVKDNADFERILEMVKEVAATGVEVCCTLGMLSEEQARRLEAAGLYAYNHNIDTSPDYYQNIVSTRTYDDRLKTLHNVRKTKVSVCSGGIIGMGESYRDRAAMLFTLASLVPPPESVPINALVSIEGTPLADQPPIEPWDVVRMIAATRIILPKAMVRLSAGRTRLNDSDQALCFLAGANSVFYGDKLLTSPNPEQTKDDRLFAALDLYHAARGSGAVVR